MKKAILEVFKSFFDDDYGVSEFNYLRVNEFCNIHFPEEWQEFNLNINAVDGRFYVNKSTKKIN